MGMSKMDMDNVGPEVKPSCSHLIYEGNTDINKGEEKSKIPSEMIWKSISPDMIPMPGTPDFCEFYMDCAI